MQKGTWGDNLVVVEVVGPGKKLQPLLAEMARLRECSLKSRKIGMANSQALKIRLFAGVFFIMPHTASVDCWSSCTTRGCHLLDFRCRLLGHHGFQGCRMHCDGLEHRIEN